MKRNYIVTENNNNKRLDVLCSSLDFGISRSMAQKIIKEGNVLVNGKANKESYKVKEGDKIDISFEEPKETKIKPQDIKLDIVYEDKDIVVVNKPKGMVVHPGNGNKEGTLVNAILNYCKDSLSGIGGEIRPGIVHRIDKDTTGLLIVAKNDKAHINMSEQIKNHEVTKIYIALVKGIIDEEEATINMPISRSKTDRKKMSVDRNGKEAVTHFKVLNRYITSKGKYSLLELKIDTGRTHQIRVHLSEIGHPVVGDEVYSKGNNEFGIRGQLLHAKRLEFRHPVTNEEMKLEAKLPEEFEKVIKKLSERQ